MVEPPAVARHRLRLFLRRAREAAGLTQGAVARELEVSLSKINRIEAGEVTVSHADLHALLRLYGVNDSEQVTTLTGQARAARRRSQWDQPRYRENLTPAMIQLFQLEEGASTIRVFEPTLVPGVCQTRAYAEDVLSFWSDELSEEQRAVRAEVRTERHRRVLSRDPAPRYLVVLDESVLLRQIGGPAVMADQLDQLLTFSSAPSVTVRVVPLAEGAPMVMLGAFVTLDVDEHESLLYREGHAVDDIVHAPDRVQRFQRIFDQMWERSLSEEASAHLISAHAATLRVAVTREGTPPASAAAPSAAACVPHITGAHD